MSKRKRDPFRDQYRYWQPFQSPDDPCPPLTRYYVVPPNLYLGFQPPCLPQYSRSEALRRGTLWPVFYSPYPPKGAKADGS